ncbi:MAG TPA: hypothetical protein VIK55_11085 [Paludibacter sp.]
MKLKEFNTSNSKMALPGEPTLRINSKAGLLGFSKAASVILGLTDQTKIIFVQDEDNPTDWYIKITSEENGFSLRRKENTSEFAFNNTPIAKLILESIKTDRLKLAFKACGFKICKTPVEIENEKYWLIITADPLNPRS